MDKATIDRMIKTYTDELMQMNKEKTLPDPPNVKATVSMQAVPEPTTPTETESEPQERVQSLPESSSQNEVQTEVQGDPIDSQAGPLQPMADELQNTNTTDGIPGTEITSFYPDGRDETPSFSLNDPENFALFSARVFTGGNVFPIAAAKVVITRNGEIFSFLKTDSNGATETVKLPSYPEINSLEPDNTRQYLDYFADVYANGFATRKNLLVSAVGGSNIILNVQLTPVSERVN